MTPDEIRAEEERAWAEYDRAQRGNEPSGEDRDLPRTRTGRTWSARTDIREAA